MSRVEPPKAAVLHGYYGTVRSWTSLAWRLSERTGIPGIPSSIPMPNQRADRNVKNERQQ